MNVATQRDIGANFVICPEVAPDYDAWTAAAGTDNAATAGSSINRLIAGRNAALSCKVGLVWRAVLPAADTLSIAFKVQTAIATGFGTPITVPARRATLRSGGATGAGTVTDLTSSLNAAGELPATVVATGAGGGSTELGVLELDCDLSGALQWLRYSRTVDMINSTATIKLMPFVLLGGSNITPGV